MLITLLAFDSHLTLLSPEQDGRSSWRSCVTQLGGERMPCTKATGCSPVGGCASWRQIKRFYGVNETLWSSNVLHFASPLNDTVVLTVMFLPSYALTCDPGVVVRPASFWIAIFYWSCTRWKHLCSRKIDKVSGNHSIIVCTVTKHLLHHVPSSCAGIPLIIRQL